MRKESKTGSFLIFKLISQFILNALFCIQNQMCKLFYPGIVHSVFWCRYTDGISRFSVKPF